MGSILGAFGPFGDLWGPFGSLLGTLWGHSGALGPPWVLFWMTVAYIWVPPDFDICFTLVLRTISMVMSVIISVIMCMMISVISS